MIEIVHETGTAHGRLEARVEGSDATGELTYSLPGDGTLVAEHTLVPAALRGQGVAGALVERLIADSRERGLRIVPQCSFVRAWFDKHPELAELRAD